jgi:aminopeptidase N
MYRWSRSASVLGCVLGLAACAPNMPALDPIGATGPIGIDILHQDVEIEPFFGSPGLRGAQSFTFRTTTGGDRLGFRGGPLKITTLSIDGRPIKDWRMSEGALDIAVGRPLRPGSGHSMYIEYEALPGRGVHVSDDLAYTGYFSCDWMVCSQEDFADRFTFDLSIRAPRGLTSLGPGESVEVTALDHDDELHHWRTQDSYPAYVHAFAIGRLIRIEPSTGCDTRLEVLSVAREEEVNAILEPTCAMLKYFEQRSGVPYSAARYSQLYDPLRWEAQEAISHSVLGGGAVKAMITDPQEDWAVAHELAHQWWGNRVTASSLSEFWLNEGVTTFMVASWKEHRWGTDAYTHEIELARRRWQRCSQEWRDVPLAFREAYPSLSALRCIQYSKAAVFLHELRVLMGDAAFWGGIDAYTTANLGRSVTSRDFEAAMQKATPVDLRPLFTQWVDPAP